MSDLHVQLNRLKLRNPILVASGTFGYAKEMSAFVDFSKLGGIVPKTVTGEPRIGNAPPRTVETTSGMLNSIGLDNDGIDTFIEKHVPYLTGLDTALIANIAGRTVEDFATLAGKLANCSGIAALELNISCPNVSGGVDFGTNADSARDVVRAVRDVCSFPIIAKLTPNVTDITKIAAGAAEGGADAVSCVNTFQGMAIDWRKRKPILGNVLGGLSGPAIKPLALRAVYQVANAIDIPIIGVGGIATIDDVMEFLIAGASAVQIGTANFYDPGVSARLVDELDQIVESEGCSSVTEIIGSLRR
ncbi:dihydroorotate dehydrogenase [Thalassoglobus polymorphus]|uniref:Dihydroorotate dehydrogenase n=1 Tax=Thalassoglobus polymorphus TaxID=2527994 RepID=A0A517QQ23_9PLAN|nr:dihydroorotate dehydrogenase [Thalassoglobus polymorphus]QDT33683.1 Dihydroorotate dehydrogenase B (NAD(+)), catalytic subunit [Thalassoglobus polymorphus]